MSRLLQQNFGVVVMCLVVTKRILVYKTITSVMSVYCVCMCTQTLPIVPCVMHALAAKCVCMCVFIFCKFVYNCLFVLSIFDQIWAS